MGTLLFFVVAFTLIPAALGVVVACLRARFAGSLTLRVKQHLPVILPAFVILFPVIALFTLANHSETICLRLSIGLQRHAGYVSASATSTLVAFVVGYCAAIAYLSRHQNTRSFVLAAVVVAMAGPISYWQGQRPVANSLTAQRTPAGVILQTSDSSCSAATLANIARPPRVPDD